MKVIQKVNCADLKSVDALLIDVTGDPVAGQMLARLFYWWARTGNKDGWVYKSANDWHAELRLTRNQVGRVHARRLLEAVGVERVQKLTMKGNPVHYRLNIKKFLTAVARYLKITIRTLKNWFSGKRDSAKPTSALPESKQANNNITSQTQLTNIPVVVPSIPNKTVKGWLKRYGEKRVAEIIRYAQDQNPSSLGGYIRRALEENWVLPTQNEIVSNQYMGKSWSDYAENNYGKAKKTTKNHPYAGMSWSDFSE
jgi:hypothetical protein